MFIFLSSDVNDRVPLISVLMNTVRNNFSYVNSSQNASKRLDKSTQKIPTLHVEMIVYC